MKSATAEPAHTTTAHGVLYEASDAPEFIESGSAKLPALDFVFGCLTTGEPAIRCEQSGRVWVGSFDGLIALALIEGVGL